MAKTAVKPAAKPGADSSSPVESRVNDPSFSDPKWYMAFRNAYLASTQGFILHGNTQDMVLPGQRLPTYLTARLAKFREIVVLYDIAGGMRFATGSMEKRAQEILGMGGQADDVLAALNESNGQQSGWPVRPAEALPVIDRLLKLGDSVSVIVEMVELLLPAAEYAFMGPGDRTALAQLVRWATDPQIEQRGNVVFLITDQLTDVHAKLRSVNSGYKALEITIPDVDARSTYIRWYQSVRALELDMPVEALANATAGLTMVALENVFLQAGKGKVTWDLVRETKYEIIASEYAGLLEILEPEFGFEAVGGMEKVKAFFTEEIIRAVKEGRAKTMPKGLIMVGPPGTGKTMLVRALAKEIGFNAVSLNMENILGGIVGTSERNLAKALSVIRSLAPVLVFMDEVDQSGVSQRGNNSGNPVAGPLFSQLLRFLGEPANRGRVVFIAASNRPDLIDPAFMRFGRVDKIIPFMLPNENERLLIVQAQAKSQGFEISKASAQKVAKATDRYAASDIAAVLAKALELSRRSGRTPNAQDVDKALEYIRPATVANARQYEILALEACNDKELLPSSLANELDDRKALKGELAEIAPSTRNRRDVM